MTLAAVATEEAQPSLDRAKASLDQGKRDAAAADLCAALLLLCPTREELGRLLADRLDVYARPDRRQAQLDQDATTDPSAKLASVAIEPATTKAAVVLEALLAAIPVSDLPLYLSAAAEKLKP